MDNSQSLFKAVKLIQVIKQPPSFASISNSLMRYNKKHLDASGQKCDATLP